MAKKHIYFGIQSYKLYDISQYTAWHGCVLGED